MNKSKIIFSVYKPPKSRFYTSNAAKGDIVFNFYYQFAQPKPES
jgi:hypothetical protein